MSDRPRLELTSEFLDELGLKKLEPEEKAELLTLVYSELELRAGTEISEPMNEQQIEEFEALHNGNMQAIRNWVVKFFPNFESNLAYRKIQDKMGCDDEDAVLRDFAQTAWLSMNSPDYRSIVFEQIEQIKQELVEYKDLILR